MTGPNSLLEGITGIMQKRFLKVSQPTFYVKKENYP